MKNIKKLAIGIINFNRSDILEQLLESIKESDLSEVDLIVADDGSTDSSIDVCKKLGVNYITGVNSGIAWNKNRALYYLLNMSTSNNILLIENDCLIVDDQWISTWASAIEQWGHINCLHPSTYQELLQNNCSKDIISGSGSVFNPYLSLKISGICIGSRRDALNQVGYLDTRFKGYGHEHSEWTLRFRRIGMGFKTSYLNDQSIKANIMISGGITAKDIISSSDKSNKEANRKVMDECKADTTYRHPWRDDSERLKLLNEFESAVARARGHAII